MKINKFEGKEEDFKFENSYEDIRINVEYPLIVARLGEERYVLRVGKKVEITPIIELIFDSSEEFIEFWKDYKTTGFDYNDNEVVSLKRILPSIPVGVYNVLKEIPIDELLIKIENYLEQ